MGGVSLRSVRSSDRRGPASDRDFMLQRVGGCDAQQRLASWFLLIAAACGGSRFPVDRLPNGSSTESDAVEDWKAHYERLRSLDAAHLACQQADASACSTYAENFERFDLPPIAGFGAADARHRACRLNSPTDCAEDPPREKQQEPRLMATPGRLEYPACARLQGLEGFVELRVVVSGDGRVLRAVPISAEPEGYFEQSAMAWAKHWQYGRFYDDDAPPVWAPQKVVYRLSLHPGRDAIPMVYEMDL